MILLVSEGREIIPEVLALGIFPSATTRLFRPFHEAVEVVCGAARAGLEVLAEGGGVDARLGGEVGFSELDYIELAMPYLGVSRIGRE